MKSISGDGDMDKDNCESIENGMPYEKPINRAVIGIALSLISLNISFLGYVISLIGMILCLLGFRILKYENKWFRGCYVITAIRTIYLLLNIILNTTIIQSRLSSSPIMSVITIVNLILSFGLLVCLCFAFKSLQQKRSMPVHIGPAIALLVFYVFMCLLGIMNYSGFIIFGIMIIAYINIVYRICKLAKDIDKSGCSCHTSHIKMTDRSIVLIIIAILAVGCSCGYIFGGSYPMKWTECDNHESSEVQEIKKRLIKLGFPEYVLNDVSKKDIMECEYPLVVQVSANEYSVDNDNTNTNKNSSTSFISEHEEKKPSLDGVKGLYMTGVAVELSGGRWKIFHHFIWPSSHKFYGTESIQLWPVYKNIEGWSSISNTTGRLLYDKKSKTYVSPFYSLGDKTFTQNNLIFGQETATDVFATFSLPNDVVKQRGYLCYSVRKNNKDCILISSFMNYTHQKTWMQYPVKTAMETRMKDGFNGSGAFFTYQDFVQFNID